jgi:hypothetical protein
MKKNFTLILMVFCALTIQAQSFVFEKDGVELSNNAEYEVSELDRAGLIGSGLELVNKTSGSVAIVVSQIVLVPPSAPNAILSICFDVCKTTNENSSTSGTLEIGENSFDVYFQPDRAHPDRAVVKYEVVNSDNPSDKIAATVTYKYGETDTKTVKSDKTLKIYQNNEQIIFNAQPVNKKGLRVNIYNIAGQLKASQTFSGKSEITLDTSLENGIYIAFLTDDKEIIETQKFIIQPRF